jgi:aminoglycoside phosphotransferase (APT) family kinase protein
MGKMHADEMSTDAALVRRLLAGQFPHWASLPIESVPSYGTDNALYRLGEDMLVRLPRIHWAVGAVDKDLRWLPELEPRLPIAVPMPLAKGNPAEGYPWEWGVYSWLEGENPPVDGVASESLAEEVSQFLRALHAVDLADAPRAGRGVPLATRDEAARQALAELVDEIDTDAAAAAWEEALDAPEWPGHPVWIHGDLLPGNFILRGGRLSGVIDWGGTGLGDPACDLLPAWGLFRGSARALFREQLHADDATWARGRGWALSVGLIALPYYKETNPGLATIAGHLIHEVLAS